MPKPEASGRFTSPSCLRVWMLACLFAACLPQTSLALETEPPLVLTHLADPATNGVPPLASLGLAIQRRAADGWFDKNGGYQSETFSVLDTNLISSFLLNFSRISLSLTLPLRSRTLNQDLGLAAANSSPSSDVTSLGLGDAQFGLYVRALTGAWQLVPYLLWKPPTGNDDMMIPDLAAKQKGGAIPLGTGSHEVDLGLSLRHRFGRHADLAGWTALRWRQTHDPLWIQQGSAIAWNGTSQARTPLWLAGLLGRFWWNDNYPGLEMTLSWLHPLALNSTNLLEGRMGLLIKHGSTLMRLQVEAPLYGRFFPDPFPAMFLNRQPSLGIAAGGEVVLEF